MFNNGRERDNSYMPNQGVCIPQEMVIENVRLAAGYVPYQYLCELFNPIEALEKATAFPELYSPFDSNENKNKAYRMSENG